MARIDDYGLASTVNTLLYGVNAVVNEVGEEIISESKRIIPLDKGDLRDSGRITPSPSGSGITIEFYSMVGDHDVALDQHENMEYNHTEGRKAHYLSTPALEIGQHLADRIAERLGG